MPLVEAVTIEVGAAIAKSILKLWMKDSKLGDDISSSLIDLLRSRTSDALAQRRGQRQFETSCAAGAPLRMKKDYTGYWQPPKEKTTTNIL